MDFQKDIIIRDKYHSGFNRHQPPTEIILHGTAGGGTLNWMRGKPIASNGQDYAEWYKKGIGLFHYLIDRAGKTTEIIDPDYFVYGANCGKHDERTIQIELENLDFNNMGHYTDAQYISLWMLLDYLFNRYTGTEVIASHDRYRMKFQKLPPKPCPGPLFQWELVRHYLNSRDMVYDTGPGYESIWAIKRKLA